MEVFMAILNRIFPDAIIYGMVAIVFLVGIFKCCRPVLRNAAALRRGSDLLREGTRANLGRPVWDDPKFLGKRLQGTWRAYLQSEDLSQASGVSTDVADYIHDDAIITDPGKASLADMIPGMCTSLGILGTFIGLSMGLSGLDVMEVSSITQLTGGIAFAFNTSIVGMLASLVFSIVNRSAVGRAQSAIDEFVSTFYANAVAQPADASTQMLATQREQADAMERFARELGGRMGGEIQRAIASAMSPVQQTMEDFIGAATRAQIDGLDYIVARFIDRMNQSLDGELKRLGKALSDAADGQEGAQANLRSTVATVAGLTQHIESLHGVTEQVIAKFTEYIGTMNGAYDRIGTTQNEAESLLEEIADTSLRQTNYLAALQEYQAKLQASFQDYTVWTDKYVGGLDQHTAAQGVTLERIAGEMRESAELMAGAYSGFTESIQLGLANALGLFNENMQTLIRQVNGTLGDVQKMMGALQETVGRAEKAISSQGEVT